MRIKDIYKKLNWLRRGCSQLGIAVTFAILSPMVFIVLFDIRTETTDVARINMLGTVGAVICGVPMLCYLLVGIGKMIPFWIHRKEKMHLSHRAYEYATDCCLKWKHSITLSIIIGIALFAIGILPCLMVSMVRNSNPRFLLISDVFAFLLGAIGIGLIVKAGLLYLVQKKLMFVLDNTIEDEEDLDFKKLKKNTVIKLAIVQVAILIVGIIMGVQAGSLSIFIQSFLLLEILLLLYILLANPFGKWHYLRKMKKGRKWVACLLSLCLVIGLVSIMRLGSWYIQPYIATIPSVATRELAITYNEETGVYTIQNPDKGDFKILQITDVHLGGSLLSYRKDMKALEAVYELIDYAKPDFVVVTGDFVFPLGFESYSFNNYTPIMQFASFMRNIGVPWAFTYGNHDTEFVASHTAEEVNDLFASFSFENTKNLLYTTKQPEITGRSNQLIEIRNADGTLNQAVFLIDSNSYASKKFNDYDYIHDDQVQWYADTVKQLSEKEGHVVSSLIFTHIPVKEYKTAYDLYKAGSEEVTYIHGAVGEKGEAICCPEYDSKLFETAVNLGSTKGIFVGHDHYNTISMRYKGIQLSYGMSIDYLAMPGISKKTKQRGATLITLKPDSQIEVENIALKDIQ
ncbi:metallophosphoesterase family protein [Anaerosporobacter faecicola]|uniref:metallophosphoesterase family protein n=1 Tax=Anaerosporobacter faecicola TaxID=2718714 RepID=UPI00143B0995|nr:metallophosphoesterase family protein [Anaerosporobacter faecicola]